MNTSSSTEKKIKSRLKGTGYFALAGIPAVWFLLFFLIPFIIVLKISFSEADFSIPPYTPLTQYAEHILNITLNFTNYLSLLSDNIYLYAFISSIKLALFSTVLCFLIGYPVAWAISCTRQSLHGLLIMLIMLPSWTSFLIRIYAWMNLLSVNGLLNSFLMKIGIIKEPLIILNTNYAVYIGIIYCYLPYMILPVYNSLRSIPHTLTEAAKDLGARPAKAFFKITLPLSKRGIFAGAFLVFIPVIGEVMIPQLLGGSQTLMIGNVLWQTFFNSNDWPMAASLAIMMLIILMVPIRLFNRMKATEELIRE